VPTNTHSTEGRTYYYPDHHALAKLLLARDERLAAAVVAMSDYRSDCVDNWDGGQYEVTLAVPAEAYDQVCDELYKPIDKACEAVVGAERYRGLCVRVLSPAAEADWAAKLLNELGVHRVPSERIDTDMPALNGRRSST
jgi:hypothetical protein